MSKQLRGNLLLLLAAMIWGAAFVAQSVGMDHMGPLSFNGIRQILAGLVLLPVIALNDRHGNGSKPVTPAAKKTLITAGGLCAIFLFLATNAQQMGLQTTAPGKAGFITALYVVLVPVASFVFLRRNPGRIIWIGVLMAVVGLWLLCCKAGEPVLEAGDILVIVCAVFFTCQILVVDHYSPSVDPVRLSCCQFFGSGILSVLIAFFTETITFEGIMGSLIPLLYAGILSCAVGYTLQIVGQKDTNPTLASLIMCLESVFSVIFGVLLVGETMTSREIWGCILMFAAVILAQLSPLLFHRSGSST